MSDQQGSSVPENPQASPADKVPTFKAGASEQDSPKIKELEGAFRLYDENFGESFSKFLKRLVLLGNVGNRLPFIASFIGVSITASAYIYKTATHREAKPTIVADPRPEIPTSTNQVEDGICRLSDYPDLAGAACGEIQAYLLQSGPEIIPSKVYCVGSQFFAANKPDGMGRLRGNSAWSLDLGYDPQNAWSRQNRCKLNIGFYSGTHLSTNQAPERVWYIRYAAPLTETDWALPIDKQRFWRFNPIEVPDQIFARSVQGTQIPLNYYNWYFPGWDRALQPGLFVESFGVSNLSGALGVAFTKYYVFLLPQGPGQQYAAVNYGQNGKHSFGKWPASLHLAEGTHKIVFVSQVNQLAAAQTFRLQFRLYIDNYLVADWNDRAMISATPFMPEFRPYGSPNLCIEKLRFVYIRSGFLSQGGLVVGGRSDF